MFWWFVASSRNPIWKSSLTPKSISRDETLEGLGFEGHSVGQGDDGEGEGGEHDGLHTGIFGRFESRLN